MKRYTGTCVISDADKAITKDNEKALARKTGMARAKARYRVEGRTLRKRMEARGVKLVPLGE